MSIRLLLFAFGFISSLSLLAQKDTIVNPYYTGFEYNFAFGFGRQSEVEYTPSSGPNIFLASQNHAW